MLHILEIGITVCMYITLIIRTRLFTFLCLGAMDHKVL